MCVCAKKKSDKRVFKPHFMLMSFSANRRPLANKYIGPLISSLLMANIDLKRMSRLFEGTDSTDMNDVITLQIGNMLRMFW